MRRINRNKIKRTQSRHRTQKIIRRVSVPPSEFGRLFVTQNIEIYEKLLSKSLSQDEKDTIEETLVKAQKNIINDPVKLESRNYKIEIL